MAQKRPSTVDQQPSPSSSEHDHEEASSSSEEDEEDDEPAPPPAPAPATAPAPVATKKPASKKPPPPPVKFQPQPSPSDSATESESGSDSESDDDEPPAAAANPKAKPVATKPFEESPKPKKPRPQPSVTPSRSASKRPGENNMHVSEPKRAKKKVSDSSAVAAEEEDEIPATEEGGKKLENDSKKLFQRIWSEEDEIAILKGLAEFSSRTGVDPYKEANAFHDFIKKSLRAEASSNQLKEKIRRLKKKFENNSGKGKNGEGPKFTKPHEQKAFELSKKVWANGGGANGGVEQAKGDGKARKSQKEGGSSRNVASVKPNAELIPQDSKDTGKKGIDENANDLTLSLSEMIRFDNILGVTGLNEDVLKRGVRLIGASKRAELEERWKNLQVAELELYVNRAELIKDQAKLIWEAYKSSNR